MPGPNAEMQAIQSFACNTSLFSSRTPQRLTVDAFTLRQGTAALRENYPSGSVKVSLPVKATRPRHPIDRQGGRPMRTLLSGATLCALLLASPTHAASVYRCVDETGRSEEHTSELQSRENLVCRLLLEKKKKNKNMNTHAHIYT